MVKRISTRWAMLVAMVVVPGLLTGCSSAEAGPLQTLTLGGQPTVDGASLEIHPGVSADFTAFVVNPLPTPVRLISATVIPVKDTGPTGQLVHVAVSLTHNMVANFHGWPVPEFPIKQLAGAIIGHGQTNIIFGVTGRVSGRNYSVAGLRIRYRYRGSVYSVMAWSAAVACVAKIFPRHLTCPDIANQIQEKVKKMAAGESA